MNKWRVSKFNSKKALIDGIVFDSQKEGNYYLYLKDQKKKGRIKDFRMQVRFDLLNSQYEHGKCILRGAFYKCDFLVINNDYTEDIIDVKCRATKTPLYMLKKKMLYYMKGLKIKEV